MSKRLMRMMYLILAAVMLLVNCAFAQAEQTETQQSTVEFTSSVTAEAVADETDGYGLTDAELLEGYLYLSSDLSPDSMTKCTAPAAVTMSTDMEKLYGKLVPMVQAVAAGKQTSTVFQIENLFTWTAENLDCGSSLSEVQTATEARLNKISPNELLQRLLSGMPYDLYWFDKTLTDGNGKSLAFVMEYGYTCTYIENTEECKSVDVTCNIKMAVSKEYAKYSDDTNYYETDESKIKAVQSTVTNAQSVVDENSGKGNYEKLVAYREWIKNAVSYNDEAAKEGESTAYGNPWQLVYVFDGDSSTNVVCEGYAKAFKYLCDLTWPDGEPVCCYLATGEISGDNVQGGHMWNIVSIGGKNYLADITNCDTEMGGYPDKLFLCGVSGSMSGGYTAEGVTYKYDDYITQVYDAAELELSETAYTPPTTYTIEQISALARYIAGIDSATPTLTDPNGDGATDAKDLTYMANHMA